MMVLISTDGSIYSHVQTCPVVLSTWWFYHGYNLNCFPNNLNILSVEEDEEEEEEHETYKTKKAPLREGPNYLK